MINSPGWSKNLSDFVGNGFVKKTLYDQSDWKIENIVP